MPKNEDNTNKKLARLSEDSRVQLLSEHNRNVSLLAKQFADKLGIGKLAELAGLCHDLGKETEDFQAYIRNPDTKRGKVKHSIHGAKCIYDLLSDNLPIAELLANCIMSHHGELRDFIAPDGETPLFTEINSVDNKLSKNIDVDMQALNNELTNELLSVHGLAPNKAFALTMITKLLYSCLVDADRLDAYLFEADTKYSPKPPDWSKMLSRLNNYLAKIEDTSAASEIATLRNIISKQCADSGERERGIYQLSVPTGGGKTLSSLRFALTHAKKHSMSRIIYVIPYLSITEQTANVIREAIGDENVLEHHSNVMQDITDNTDDNEQYKLQTSRWDEHIIITTQVQFLESIFSAKGSDLRKLHNMADSVIIFDEVQSLPIKCIHLFNSALNFLHKVCKCTVLLCTATQPLLDNVEKGKSIILSEKPSIAECGKIPKRYIIDNCTKLSGYTHHELAQFVLEKHNTSTLVIVNTKAAAKSLFSELESSGAPVVHLSTGMCKAHREKVFFDVKRNLSNHSPIICISTQLIEAGVDISFECVIRDIAGYDSILQAAGRCNRHGEFKAQKSVYVVNIKGENLSRLPDIKIGADVTMRLLGENTPEAERMEQYYKYYFHARKKQMDYPIDSGHGSIYDLLTSNAQGISALRNRGSECKVELRPAIRSAAKEFYVIASGQTDVIVRYGNSEKLLNQFDNANDLNEKRALLREMSKYSVSLYPFQFNELKKRGALVEENGLLILNKGFYNEQIGVNIEGRHELLEV